MDAVTITTKVGKNRQILVDVPDDLDVTEGAEVDLVIRKHQLRPVAPGATLTREEARAKLLAAGLLREYKAPEGVVPLTPEERLSLVQRPPGSPSLDDMINEDRGPY